MVGLVAGEAVRCELDGTSTHERCVAICYLDGWDVAAESVHAGLARDRPAFSAGWYAGLELTAAADGAEIREAHRLPGYCR